MGSPQPTAWALALGILATFSGSKAQDIDSPTVLTGRVIREVDASPVVGATVRLQRPIRINYCATGWVHEQPSTVLFDETDADGRFEFQWQGGLGLHSLVVMPTADTGVAGIARSSRPALDVVEASESADVVCIAPPHCSASGRTLDERGVPVAGAQVHVWHGTKIRNADRTTMAPDATVISDAAGHFRLASLGAGAIIEVEAEGFAPNHSLRARVEPGEHMRGLRLVLHRERFMSGRVVDEAGDARAGVTITARRDSFRGDAERSEWPGVVRQAATPWTSTTTADDGTFRLGPLPYDTVTLTIPGMPKLPWSKRVDTDGAPLAITLERGARLTGIVRGPDGSPISGAAVATHAYNATPGRQPGDVVTGSDGVYELLGVPVSDSAVVTVKAAGHAWAVSDGIVIPAPGSYRRDITLEPAATLTVRILTPEGEPYAHQSIAWRGDRAVAGQPVRNRRWELLGFANASWSHALGRRDAYTDEEGVLTIDALYAGEYTLHVPRHEQIFRVSPSPQTIELRLTPADDLRRRLVGRVVSAEDGGCLDDYDVTVQRGTRGPREPDPIEARADQFTVEIGRGNSRVWVTAPDRAYWVESFSGSDALNFQRVVELPRAHRLTVRVVDRDHAPVRMSNVAIYANFPASVLFDADGRLCPGFSRVNRDGTLHADRLPPGFLTVTASVPHPYHGWTIAALGSVNVTDVDRTYELELVVDP